ncbi:MAG: hypothetical protein M3273_07875, partial [Actinomycetota bacterium]|nr:hypothetical protein [Actinomycetota bacterium]
MRIPLLWRLAPATLLRFPRSAAAVAFSAAVVVVASVMGPLFLDSSERASLEAELERTGRWRAGMQILHRPVQVAAAFEEQVRLRRLGNEVQRLLEARVEGVEGLGSPVTTFLGPFAVARSGDETSTVRMISRTDALANVTVVDSAGEGVWIADVTADALGVGAGDRISIGSGESFRVGGVYRALAEDRPRAYWDPLGDFIFKQTSADAIPPPFLIGSGDAYVELLARLDPSMQVRWQVPLSSEDIPPERAASVAREIERITGETEGGSHPIGRTLLDLGGLAYDPLVTSLLPGIMSTAAERIETSRAPATVLTVAARLLGAGLMTAAGISLVSRRRSEVRALIARGVGPRALGVRFLVEGVASVALGGAVGLAAAFGGVALLGAV